MKHRKVLLDYTVMAAGAVMAAVGVKFFLVPNDIAPAGFTGIAAILRALGVPLEIGTLYLLLNIPFFYLALRTVGRRFIIRTLYAMVIYSAAADIVPTMAATHDLLLASIYGGIISGAGFGLILRFGGTTGGTDTCAKILTRKSARLTVGMAMFVIDTVVVAASGLVFGFISTLYAIVTLAISDRVVDMVSTGASVSKAFLVISDHSAQISGAVLERLSRGVTHIYAQGAFSRTEKNMLLCVVSGNSEAVLLKNIVFQIDESAFVISWNANEVLGYGFLSSKGEK